MKLMNLILEHEGEKHLTNWRTNGEIRTSKS